MGRETYNESEHKIIPKADKIANNKMNISLTRISSACSSHLCSIEPMYIVYKLLTPIKIRELNLNREVNLKTKT